MSIKKKKSKHALVKKFFKSIFEMKSFETKIIPKNSFPKIKRFFI